MNPTIFVVDDDPVVNKVLGTLLTKAGYHCRNFLNKTDFYAGLAEGTPNLILLDLNFGNGMAGFDMLEHCRNMLGLTMPIIVVSSEGQTMWITHALELGANDFTLKPVRESEIKKKVEEHLHSTGLTDSRELYLNPISSLSNDISLQFKVHIREITANGILLESSHLVCKGASITLTGEDLYKYFQTKTDLKLIVVNTAALLGSADLQYLVWTEFEPNQEQALGAVKRVLEKVQSNTSY